MGDPKEQPTSDDEAFAAAVWDGADVGRNSAGTHLIHDPPCACGGYTEISRGVARFVGRFPICPVCGASLRSSPRSDVFGGGRDLLAEAHERADRLEVERVGLVEQVRELTERAEKAETALKEIQAAFDDEAYGDDLESRISVALARAAGAWS